MLNCFLARRSEQLRAQAENCSKKRAQWLQKYHGNVRPMLLEKYNRRINNFIVRLEEDKKELYEYRMETESKAHELLKEISKKERYLGDQTIKLRDVSDWNSLLPTAERIEKEKNKQIFEKKYGDANIAYRSIASQSMYNPAGCSQFRTREKQKELHTHSMRFTTKNGSFSQNRKVKNISKSLLIPHPKIDDKLMRHNSNASGQFDEEQSQAHSTHSESLKNSMVMEEETSSVHRDQKIIRPSEKKSSKVYFKQIVDLEQNVREKTAKKSLHQILVRFGITRIKDVKKQAMVQTDNLSLDQL